MNVSGWGGLYHMLVPSYMPLLLLLLSCFNLVQLWATPWEVGKSFWLLS